VLVALVGVFIAPSFAAQRLVLPELVGEDETVVAQANAVFEGVLRATGLLGPVAAGLLISAFGAPAVLYADAASFLFAFVMLWLFVPQHPPKAATAESRGVLAGVRFIRGDHLLSVVAGTSLLINMFAQMLVAALPVLAYEDFDGNPRVAGAFFAAFGLGAVVGSVIAVRLVPRFDPIRLGAAAFAAMTVPIWLLVFPLAAVGVVLALAVSALFGPLINAPLIGVITMRTPEALRPKVMTAVITTAMLAGPFGLLIAGPLLEWLGPQAVFLLVAAGETLAVIPFAVFAFRRKPAGPALAA
jgi:predicted MFS family arabinose efflux permease